MVFSNKIKRYSFDFKLSDQSISYEEHPKFLERTFDWKLIFKQHFEEINEKCAKS
jgi:hypothetical protein